MTGSGFSFDREKLHMNLARIKKGKDVFEIVIEPDLAMDYKAGKSISLHEVLKDEFVFSNAREGLKASEHKMKEIFGTSDPLEVAKEILDKGEVQETAKHRAKIGEEKRKKIVEIVHRYGVDPRTHLPHPLDRIERAIEESKFRMDSQKSAQEQIEDVLKAIRPILPIRLESKQIEVRIPAQYGAKCYAAVKSFGTILKDEWMSDGSWLAVVEMPAGMEPDFYEKINAMSHGNVESKVILEK